MAWKIKERAATPHLDFSSAATNVVSCGK